MIDYKYKGLFNQNSVEKQVTISYENTTITNEDLFNNEMTIEESLCSENQLKFGSCEASMVKFKVANIFSPMVGKTIDISVVLKAMQNLRFDMDVIRCSQTSQQPIGNGGRLLPMMLCTTL